MSVRRERIAEHLRARGLEVDIQDTSGFDAFTATWKAISGDYDVIAGNVRIGLYIGYPLSRLLGTAFLGDVSDPIEQIVDLPGPIYRVLRWYEWQVLKRADAAVFVYESSYQDALSRGIDGEKLSNAVDFERFADPDDSVVEEARRIMEDEGVDMDKPIAMYVGSMISRSYIQEIIDAARMSPKWEFVFLGDGKLAEYVTTISRELSNVHYPGSFEYRLMPGFLAHASAGFCLVDAEQPLKLKEYGAAGVPTIAQHGVLEEWYDEDELTFIKPTADSISETLIRMSEEGQTMADRAANLRRIVGEHNWEHVASRYDELFRDIIDRRRRQRTK